MADQDLGRSVLHLVTDNKGIGAGIAAAKQEAISGLRTVQQSLSAAGAQLGTTGRALGIAVTAPIVAAGTAIFEVGKNFEETMDRIVGLTDVTRDQLGGIKTDILAIAKETGRAPQELAEAFYFVASAGFSAAEATDVLKTSAIAAATGLGTTQDVAKVLGLTLNAYGHQNITAAHAADVLTAAVKDGTAEASALGGVLGRVVPTAAVLGVSFDQVTAALSAMTLSGISADEASTSLNAVLVSLLKPTTQAEDALSKLGLSSAGLREELKDKGLLDVLRTLQTAFQGDDEAATAVFGNVRALRGVLSLLGLDQAQLNKVFTDTAAASGDLAKGYKDTEGTARDYERVQADISTTLIELSTDVMPTVLDVLRTLAGLLREAAAWFKSLPPDVRKTVVEVSALAALAGPVLIFSGAVVTATGSLAGLATAAAPLLPLLLAINYAADKYNKITGPDAKNQMKDDFQWQLDHPLIPLWFRGIAEGLGLVAKEGPPAAAALTDTQLAIAKAMSDLDNFPGKVKDDMGQVPASFTFAAAGGPEAYQARQKAALDKAIADQQKYTSDALAGLRKFRTDIESAFGAAQDAAIDREKTKVAITAKNAELNALDKERTKNMGTWTKAQKAEWQLRKDEALAELSALKLHAALIGTDMDKAVALQSLLTSKDMKDGLTSKFPETKAAYQALRDEAITSLQQLASQGGPAAKTAASAVAKFLDPHNPLSPLHDAATWGYYTGTAFGDAIARGIAHAQYLVKASLKGMQALLLASSPPGPESPLHEIDVWGERTGRAWLDPLVGVIRGASSALRPGLADAGRMLMTPMGSAGLQLAAAGAGVGLGGFSRNVPPPGQVLTGHTGPLIGELNVDARGHPDAAGVGAAVKQAVGDAMADVFRDQAARGLTGVKL